MDVSTTVRFGIVYFGEILTKGLYTLGFSISSSAWPWTLAQCQPMTPRNQNTPPPPHRNRFQLSQSPLIPRHLGQTLVMLFGVWTAEQFASRANRSCKNNPNWRFQLYVISLFCKRGGGGVRPARTEQFLVMLVLQTVKCDGGGTINHVKTVKQSNIS